MAFPFKSGIDLYNNEALRMRLHNLGADPTEVGAGLIYFNTSTGLNTSGKARIYTGSAWKTLAFAEDLDVASNADFVALKEKVELLSGDVDTDSIISNMKEVSAFLAGFAEDASLMNLLNSKLSTSGGTIKSTGGIPLTIKRPNHEYPIIAYYGGNDELYGYIGVNSSRGPVFLQSDNTVRALLHSGNVGEYNAGSATKLQTARTIWGQPFDGTRDITEPAKMQVLYFINNDGSRKSYIGRASSVSDDIIIEIPTSDGFRVITKGEERFRINSSGNVTIGSYDLAGAGYKLYIENGKSFFNVWNNSSLTLGAPPNNALLLGDANNGLGIWYQSGFGSVLQSEYFNGTSSALSLILQPLGGNVLIGTTTDNGAKLQVAGHLSSRRQTINNIISVNRDADTGAIIDSSLAAWRAECYADFVVLSVYKGDGTAKSEFLKISPTTGNFDIKGNLRVTGNIIADGEVSAGGDGEEGAGNGTGANIYATQIAKNTTSMTVTHNLGTRDVVVSIYERDATSTVEVWNMILTDIEITDANSIRVTFGSATTVVHKVVIFGASA